MVVTKVVTMVTKVSVLTRISVAALLLLRPFRCRLAESNTAYSRYRKYQKISRKCSFKEKSVTKINLCVVALCTGTESW